jgi:cytochrome c556
MIARKLPIVLAAMCATALIGVGLSAQGARQDDESPLHKIMEKVQANNVSILKGVRTAVNYKKSQGEVADAAKQLVELGKQAKPLGAEPAKKENQPISKWEALNDAFVKEAQAYAELLAKKDTDQKTAKASYKTVQKSCTDCHDVFRKDIE